MHASPYPPRLYNRCFLFSLGDKLRPAVWPSLLLCLRLAVPALPTATSAQTPKQSAGLDSLAVGRDGTSPVADSARIAPSYHLPAVIVTANRLPEPLDRISSSATVLLRQDIEDQQARTVAEVLRNVPGLDMVRSGSLGQAASAFLRGAGSSSALVLLDGVQVNSPTTGGFNFGNLTTDNIESIEVVRGPQSTLYGSDAIGGVIHIISHKGEGDPRLVVRSEAGQFSTFRESAHLAGSRGRVNYAVSLSRTDSEGAFGNDDYGNSTLAARVESSLSDNLKLSLVARAVGSGGGVPGQRFIAFDPNARIEDRLATVALRVDHVVRGRWHHRLVISRTDDDLLFDDPVDPGATGPFAGDLVSRTQTSIATVDWQLDFYLLPSNVIVAGVEWQRLVGKNVSTGPFGDTDFDEEVASRAIYIQNQFRQNDRFSLTTGVRVDDHGSFGPSTNLRITSAYTVHPLRRTATKVKGSWGTGFRAPSINELYFPGYGNPDLKPEENRSFEVGLEQELLDGRIGLAVSYFHTDFENLIGFDPSTFSAGNISAAKSEGIEWTGNFRLNGRLRVSANYTFLDTEDEATGKPLLRRPAHKANININLNPVSPLNLNLDINLVGQRFDNDFGAGGEAFYPGYAKLDVALWWDLSGRLRLLGRVENLMDAQYEEAAGFPAPGRAFYGGVQIEF